MNDGVCLSTDILLPDTKGPFPALITRTPYDKSGFIRDEGRYFAKRGYAVVIQDVRGRFASEGVFDPMQNETMDGYETQRWTAAQPWCNGNTGTFGGSYVGFTQWMPAPLNNPNLVTMIPAVTFADLYHTIYHGGAYRLRLSSSWGIAIWTPYDTDLGEIINRIDEINMHLPLLEQDRLAGWKINFLRDLILHPTHDKFWDRTSVHNGYQSIKTSILNIGGWFDICLNGTLNNFTAMTGPNIDPEIRKKQKLLIGPWIHGISTDRNVGELDFGEESLINIPELQLRWFDNQLKGIDNGISEKGPVTIFVMGDNKWRDEKEWPLARTRYTRYYVHSRECANSLYGDGFLDTAYPEREIPDRFIYDPANPVPTDTAKNYNGFTHGPRDQQIIEKRKDILVYSTAPLKNEIEVTGPVKTILYAASTAKNTDFTAKLVDVYPDGRSIRLCDGIIRASFRNGQQNISNIEPETVYKYEIDLWATSNVFRKGHRIRIEISSSNFPRFDRNLNTGRNFATDSTWVKAEQSIYHSREYPSHIILPVIPRE